MSIMILRIVSIEGELYNGNIDKVSFPTPQGIVTVLPGHINIVSTLDRGVITYLPEDKEQTSLEEFTEKAIQIPVTGGMAMVEDNVITIVAE